MSLSEVQERVLQLETAIKRLDIVKKHLNRNASDVKAEIHASVSRNLECLRNREVTLLRQVDQVLRVKEETLQQQQARLNQTLGVLRTGLSMILEHTTSERQLAETLEKLNRIELSPEETPYISFRADHVKLRESILHYGRVDASGLPPLIAFNDPGNPSASLPRHLEEYQDVDHHVFYKTLEELKRTKSSSSGVRSINVAIPKLSTHVEDWLQKRTPVTKPKTEVLKAPDKRPPAIRPNLLSRSGDVPTVGLSDTPTPSSSCSLNSWLSLIKQHADLEEEHDFEIVDNSCLQKADIKSPVANSETPVDSSQSVKKDLRNWLLSSNGCSSGLSSTFFNSVPSDSKFWLVQTDQQRTSLDDLKHFDFFKDVSNEPSTWLHSQADCEQPSTSQGKREEEDQKHCLQGQNKEFDAKLHNANESTDRRDNANNRGHNGSSTPEDEGKWLICNVAMAPAFQLEDICQTSDTCMNISNCSSQSECLRPCSMEKSAVKGVAVPVSSFKPLSVTSHEWPLLASQKLAKYPSAGTGKSENGNLFSHIPNAGNSVWLLKSNRESAPELGQKCSSGKSKDDKEAGLWLQTRGRSGVLASAASVCNRSATAALDFCMSDWLMVPAKDKDGCPNELDQNKDESEG